MKNHILATVVALLTCFASDLNARIVTLTGSDTKSNDSLTIGTNESLTILSGGHRGSLGANVEIDKDGFKRSFDLGDYNSQALTLTRMTIAGPAKISLNVCCDIQEVSKLSFLTVEVLPDLYPPDKTLVLPQGDGANIILESSTNLVHWSPAPLGSYTNKTANLFFRIRAERLQLSRQF